MMLAQGLKRFARLLGCGALLAALPLVATLAQGGAEPVVDVTGGKVQGQPMAGGGAAFKGIPYGAPPIGPLRWRETQPVQPWNGVLQAGAFRTGCGLAPAGSKAANEDCLYLNVWAPEWPAKAKRPVMFWINGGELFGGSGALNGNSESLARRGVVLVSANYRGTLLGMMGHPELTAESPHKSSANYMFHDQVAILHWIHDNIAKFGGDPNNVTVFGQSGGAHAISMLLATPMTRGLIHKASISSGAPMQATRPYLTLAELERIGTVTAEVLKAPATGSLAYLRGLPAEQIVAAMPQVRARLLEMNGGAYDEGTDGYVIPQPPGEVWAGHKEPAIPLIIGSTAQDTAGTIRGMPIPGPNATPEQARAYKREAIELFFGDDPDLVEQAKAVYGVDGPAKGGISDYAPYSTPQQQLGTDLNHRCGTILSAEMHSAIAPTYLFEFSRTSARQPPTHSSELRFLFGRDDLEDAQARQLSETMQRYWTNFARTGDPNGPGLPKWPKYEVKAKGSIDFTNAGPVQRTASRAVACAPYEAKIKRDRTPLTGGEKTFIRGPAITANMP